MATEKELNLKITEITMLIRDKYPELSKYIAEMPDTIPNDNNPEMGVETLLEYYNSLESLVSNYDHEHGEK